MRGNLRDRPVLDVDVDTPPYQRHPNQRPQLTDAEIDDIEAFLYTLTDGYKPERK